MYKKRLFLILKGGLGNQLFQYAAAKNIALNNGSELVLDIDTGFKNDLFNRRYALDIFQLSVLVHSSISLLFINFLKFLKKSGFYKISILNKVLPALILENSYSFDESIKSLKFSSNAIIEGYFHSEKYFIDIRNILLEEFKFKNNSEYLNVNFLKQIQLSESVSVHVRNYANPKTIDTTSIHGICSITYYLTAIELIKGKLSNPVFYIFSDDIPWAKKYINFDHVNCYFVEKTESFGDQEDFRLMMNCKHNIIANSSFSWWCAWLNNYHNKIVIAPEKWLNTDNFDFSQVIPETWIKIGTS